MDELNVMNPKQKDCVFLKIHIGFEMKGKMFGKSNFESAGLLKNSSRCFTNPECDQVAHLKEGWIAKFLCHSSERFLKPENQEDNFEKIYFEFF